MWRRKFTLRFMLGLLLVFTSGVALAQYQLTNLVSNQVGKAKHTDPLLVNAWGLVHARTSPFWISDNGSGWSTLYNGNGVKQGLIVEITPHPGNAVGSPTGIVFNGSSEFQVDGWTSIFLFATLDGTISAWAPQTNFNQATLASLQNQPKGASYTGLAITNKASGNFLYAADIANSQVEIFD